MSGVVDLGRLVIAPGATADEFLGEGLDQMAAARSTAVMFAVPVRVLDLDRDLTFTVKAHAPRVTQEINHG